MSETANDNVLICLEDDLQTHVLMDILRSKKGKLKVLGGMSVQQAQAVAGIVNPVIKRASREIREHHRRMVGSQLVFTDSGVGMHVKMGGDVVEVCYQRNDAKGTKVSSSLWSGHYEMLVNSYKRLAGNNQEMVRAARAVGNHPPLTPPSTPNPALARCSSGSSPWSRRTNSWTRAPATRPPSPSTLPSASRPRWASRTSASRRR
jgi:hypothetical protein